MAPDGEPAQARRASRFRSAQAEAEALGRARAQLEADLRAGKVRSYTDPVTGAQVYVNPADGQPVRHPVGVVTNDPRGFGESTYVARRIGGDREQGFFVLDRNGHRLTRLVRAPQGGAVVTYEYVPSVNDWRPVTSYPESRP